ncbi:ABC transporter permease [Zhihengliuella halotolerans]|uniref:Transport permease protein n=1 Tax=Zhihengliuella halotolerans TaxID=370736 RepID=A0A4Q8AGM4_9MICC|nr:ABC transporter permease [Zhihengliuella halotolerans]RZU63530.1 ABC-2 type transport system permease protein [Zhihengliuella halotolerans]
MITTTPARAAAARHGAARRALSDTGTLLNRGLKRLARYPSMLIMMVGLPVLFLLMFVYVFGGMLGAQLGGTGGTAAYLQYVVPGIVLMAVGSGGAGTAIYIAMDMRQGIAARLATMDVSRAAILTAHALVSVVQALLATIAVGVVAVLLGFRPTGGVTGVLGALAVVAGIAFAITWLCLALGIISDTVETASNLPMPLSFLPFLSSGFVPTDTMPGWLRVVAEYQPFTPFIETVRGLLMGTGTGDYGLQSLIWVLVVTGIGMVWSLSKYSASQSR